MNRLPCAPGNATVRTTAQARTKIFFICALLSANMSVRDVIIVGAGPSGLSAAIAAKPRGLEYQVLEQGVLVNSIYRFPPQMVFFTTPELLEIGGLPFVSPRQADRAEALKCARLWTPTICRSREETVLSVEREDNRAGEAGGAIGAGEAGRRSSVRRDHAIERGARVTRLSSWRSAHDHPVHRCAWRRTAPRAPLLR
jgi:hypothetical protein